MTVMSCVLTRVAVIVLTRIGAPEHLTQLNRWCRVTEFLWKE